MVTHIGDSIPESDPEATLQGDIAAILDKIERYREAGVDRLVLEIVSAELDEFLNQLVRFAEEVTPHIAGSDA